MFKLILSYIYEKSFQKFSSLCLNFRYNFVVKNLFCNYLGANRLALISCSRAQLLACFYACEMTSTWVQSLFGETVHNSEIVSMNLIIIWLLMEHALSIGQTTEFGSEQNFWSANSFLSELKV